jgi:hypothetical protein
VIVFYSVNSARVGLYNKCGNMYCATLKSDNNSSLKVMLFILAIVLFKFSTKCNIPQTLNSSTVNISEFQKYGTTVHASLLTYFCFSHSQNGIRLLTALPLPPKCLTINTQMLALLLICKDEFRGVRSEKFMQFKYPHNV